MINLGMEFTELQPGMHLPALNAIWLKARARLELEVRHKMPYIHVYKIYNPDHFYKSGSIARDGCCIYRPSRLTKPELYFREIQKKKAKLTFTGSAKSGELACAIICGLTGDDLGSLALHVHKTLAFAKKAIDELLRTHFKLVGQTVLDSELQGHPPRTMLKSFLRPSPEGKLALGHHHSNPLKQHFYLMMRQVTPNNLICVVNVSHQSMDQTRAQVWMLHS